MVIKGSIDQIQTELKIAAICLFLSLFQISSTSCLAPRHAPKMVIDADSFTEVIALSTMA